MRLLWVPAEKNACYIEGDKLTPKGIMWHSTAANNPALRRYVQPTPEHPEYREMTALLGENVYGNDWCNNRKPGGRNVCVHAFIGKLADSSIATAQILPWEYRGWHAGKSAGNNAYIGFEICEDNLKDADYFAAVYREAVELTAYLCEHFGLDPLADGVVICHSEGHRRGVASNHGDVMHWFPRFGKTMDTVRKDVKEAMDTMSYEKFCEYMSRYEAERGALPPGDWSEEARAWAHRAGIITGYEDGTMRWKQPVTREEYAVMEYRRERGA